MDQTTIFFLTTKIASFCERGPWYIFIYVYPTQKSLQIILLPISFTNLTAIFLKSKFSDF